MFSCRILLLIKTRTSQFLISTHITTQGYNHSNPYTSSRSGLLYKPGLTCFFTCEISPWSLWIMRFSSLISILSSFKLSPCFPAVICSSSYWWGKKRVGHRGLQPGRSLASAKERLAPGWKWWSCSWEVGNDLMSSPKNLVPFLIISWVWCPTSLVKHTNNLTVYILTGDEAWLVVRNGLPLSLLYLPCCGTGSQPQSCSSVQYLRIGP